MVAILLILVFLSAFGHPVNAAVELHVTPDTVTLGEAVDAQFTVTGGWDGEPDFTPLRRSFDILGQAQGTQVSAINGRVQRSTTWNLTLMPNAAGELEIPPIAFGAEQSPPRKVIVLEAAGQRNSASANEEVVLEVDAEPKNPYVQAQVLLSVKVLHRVPLSGAELADLAPGDFLVEQLGQDRKSTEQRGGERYAVIERRYALFPQKSGELTIPPLQLNVELGGGAWRGDPFFGGGRRSRPRLKRLSSPAIPLAVRPIPNTFKGKTWLPAANVTLTDHWPSGIPEIAVGDPLSRTIRIDAQSANIGSVPELKANAQLSPGIKEYPENPIDGQKPTDQGLVSFRELKTAIIPAQPGTYELPPQEIHWWNTAQDREEIASLPARKFVVAGDAPPPPPAPAEAPEPVLAPNAKPSETGAEPATAGQVHAAWFWTACGLAAGWLTTALAWVWTSRTAKRVAESSTGSVDSAVDRQAALAGLRTACQAGDLRAIRDRLLQWGSAAWPNHPPLSLTALASRVDAGLAEQLRTLERALYGNATDAWLVGDLYEQVARIKPIRSHAGPKGGTPLAPLIPETKDA